MTWLTVGVAGGLPVMSVEDNGRALIAELEGNDAVYSQATGDPVGGWFVRVQSYVDGEPPYYHPLLQALKPGHRFRITVEVEVDA